MSTGLIVKVNVISREKSYWETNNPVIPIGEAAYAIGDDAALIRVGDGKTKYKDLPVTNTLGGNTSVPKITISSSAPSGAGVENQLWFQYI